MFAIISDAIDADGRPRNSRFKVFLDLARTLYHILLRLSRGFYDFFKKLIVLFFVRNQPVIFPDFLADGSDLRQLQIGL